MYVIIICMLFLFVKYVKYFKICVKMNVDNVVQIHG